MGIEITIGSTKAITEMKIHRKILLRYHRCIYFYL